MEHNIPWFSGDRGGALLKDLRGQRRRTAHLGAGHTACAGASQGKEKVNLTRHEDSVFTLMVELSQHQDYGGGGGFTILATTKGGDTEGEAVSRSFGFGDGVLFMSEEGHGVSPVTRGRNTVLAVEFWYRVDIGAAESSSDDTDYLPLFTHDVDPNAFTM